MRLPHRRHRTSRRHPSGYEGSNHSQVASNHDDLVKLLPIPPMRRRSIAAPLPTESTRAPFNSPPNQRLDESRPPRVAQVLRILVPKYHCPILTLWVYMTGQCAVPTRGTGSPELAAGLRSRIEDWEHDQNACRKSRQLPGRVFGPSRGPAIFSPNGTGRQELQISNREGNY
jgi:hypothetical protein